MLRSFAKWFAQCKARRAAVAAALEHFKHVHDRKAHSRMSSIIAEEPNSYVVRVCHGDVRPPRRDWYRISSDGEVLGELTFADVQHFGERYWC
jgi:hypothetical protein